MTTVYWGHYTEHKRHWLELALIEPIPALREIIKARDVTHERHFTRCPAFTQYYKNTYVIKSPIDIEFIYDPVSKLLRISPQNQAFYEANIEHRGAIIGEHDDFLMSLVLNFLFISDKDCDIELLPCLMHKSEFVDSTRIVVGTFNINKWYRPIELPFEFKNSAQPIKVKRGDALAYVRFLPKDNAKIKLQHKNFSEETLDAVDTCLAVKDLNNKLPLELLYKLSERIRNKLWFNKKQCPFRWRKNK
jgi:hypothetical protein